MDAGLCLRSQERTKLQLMQELYETIVLEKQLLGDRAHRVIRDIDLQIPTLQQKQKRQLAREMKAKVEKLWEPLKEIQVLQQVGH